MKDSWIRRYQLVLRQRLPVLLVISFIAAAAAYVVSYRLGPVSEVHFSYLISLSEREQSVDYQFDGYYALQATDLFAATLASWITAPEVISRAYENAELKPPTNDPRLLTKQVSTEKSAAQIVKVTVRSDTDQTAGALALGLQEEMQNNVSLYHDEGVPALTFRVVATKPWTGKREVSVLLIVTATFVATLILGINTVLLRESLNKTDDGT